MPRRKKYVPAEGWVRPLMNGYLLKCCDCALVHRVDFKKRPVGIEIRIVRDDRKTAASRRKTCRT
jgi:hypothetical protein